MTRRDNEEEEASQRRSDACNHLLSAVLAHAGLQLRSASTLSDASRNSWDDYMREGCRRDDFYNLLPQLLRGEAPQFQAYIQRLAQAQRSAGIRRTDGPFQ